jgi:hypothetical protein
MKRVLIVLVLVIAAAGLGLWRTHGSVGLSRVVGLPNDSTGEARDEVHKSFELQPGARLEVQGINGKVEIQTSSDTKTAEVYILRTGTSSESLSRREVVIEQTATGLLVRGREARHIGFFEHLFGKKPKEEITIKAPRQIALALKGINGQVTSGDIDGPIEAKGINGNIDLGQASELADIAGVNGRIVVGLKQLGDRGARFNGINGGVELRLGKGVNADLTARGMNGSFLSDIPEVIVAKEDPGSRYSARIGTGGAPIEFKGINGNVRLSRIDEPAISKTTEKKSTVETEKAAKIDRGAKSSRSVQ